MLQVEITRLQRRAKRLAKDLETARKTEAGNPQAKIYGSEISDNVLHLALAAKQMKPVLEQLNRVKDTGHATA